MNRLNRIKIIYLIVVVAVIFGGFGLIKRITNQNEGEDMLSALGQQIYFAYTDDNTGEDLIIKSDKKDYDGFNGNTVYFNITNTKRRTELIDLQVHFNNGQAGVASIEKWDKFANQWIPLADQPFVLTDEIGTVPRSEGLSLSSGLITKKQTEYLTESKQTNYFKMAINYPPLSKGEFYIEAKGKKGGYGLLDPWYSSNWKYQKKITINKDQVTTDATDFPVLATTTDTDLRDKARSDGYDIVFTDSAGTALNWEREKYDNSTGELVAWIKTDVSSTTDTILYMYYGNSSASDNANAAGVWDDNYVGVWHLAHDGTATTTYPDFLDSTSNDNDGSSKNMTGDISTLIATSTIDGGVGFDGVDDYVNLGESQWDGSWMNHTITAWVKFDGIVDSEQYTIVSKGGGTPNGFSYRLELPAASGGMSNHIFTMNNVGRVANTQITSSDGIWHFLTVSLDSSNIYFYLDGNADGSNTHSYANDNDWDMAIGSIATPDWYFNGTIDEVRISNTALSAQRIETEYNNQVSVGNFLTFGSEQTDDWYNTTWKYRKKITIDKDKITANLADFPVLVNTADSGLAAKARSDGYDIVFTSSDGKTALNYEREKFSTTTNELVAWVQTDVSSTTDTVLYMYYGNPSASDQATTTGVWDDTYKLVQHMHHDWDATAEDSTKYDNDGINTNFYSATSTVSTSQIDGGIDFDGVDDYVNFGSDSSIKPNIVTVSAWIKTNTKPADTARLVMYRMYGYHLGYNYNGTGYFGIFDSDATDYMAYDTTYPVTDNVWHHLVGTYDGSRVKFYLDGVPNDDQPAGTIYYGSGYAAIGRAGDNDSLYVDGIIDEVRVLNTARSAQWIETEYNNQSSPSDFYSYGVEEQYNRATKVNVSLVDKYTDSSLVGHWTFNGQDMDWASTTAEVLDRSGNDNNGDVTNFDNSSAVPGISGQALEFDGSDDYVEVSSPTMDFATNNEITSSLWFNVKGNMQDAYGQIMRSYAGSGSKLEWEESSSHIIFRPWSSGTSGTQIAWDDSTISENEWHHLVGVYTGTQLQIYLDGVKENTDVDVTVGLTNPSTMFIGQFDGTAGAGPFNGILDEVRIYDRALGADEILDLYQAGARRLKLDAPLTQFQTGGLVGHWTFNGQDMDWGANKALDRSGQGNNGAITSMSTSTSPAPGISGQGLDFDGSDDYVSAPDSSSLDSVTDDLTITAWIKPDSGNDDAFIVSKGQNTSSRWEYMLWNWDFNIMLDDSYDVVIDANFSPGEWAFIAWVKSGTNSRHFKNNTELASRNDAPSPLDNNSAALRIGDSERDGNYKWDGLIDEVRIYNRALSTDEIMDLYQAGTRRFKLK